MRLKLLTAIAIAVSVVVASGVNAAEPPVVDQYTEQIPTPAGDQPASNASTKDSRGGGVATGGPGGSTGSQQGVVAGSLGGSVPNNGSPSESGSTNGSSATRVSDPNTTFVTEKIGSTSEDGGMDLLFPAILLLAAVGVIAAVIIRRRADQTPVV